MKQLSDCTDILIAAPFFLGYLWAADKFFKKFLGTSKRGEWLFLIFSFCGWLLRNLVCQLYAIPYIFSALLASLFFVGLVVLLFGSDREKRILAASMLIMTERLAANFCTSFLSCLALFFLHIVKKIPEPFLNEWENGFICGGGYCFVTLVICWMMKRLEPVFGGKPKKWYAILVIPLLVMITVFDVAGWGASHGIMVRSGAAWVCIMTRFSAIWEIWFWRSCLCLRQGFMCLE